MRNRFIVFLLLVSLFVLSSCSKNNNTNINDYGHWSNAVKSVLNEDFDKSLPDEQTVCAYGETYYYNKKQGVLGDLNFVIYVVLQFDDKTSYESELSKYTRLCIDNDNNVAKTEDTLHYVIQGSTKNALEFLDDKIYDGMFYNFEIISASPEDFSITFVNAHVWDYSTDQVLARHLQMIYNISE